MGYHVTILRSKEGRQLPILRSEVEAAVAARPELAATPSAQGALDITVLDQGEASPLLVWQEGEVWTRTPDEETLKLMLELAEALGARVRGDELETYRGVADTYEHPDDAAELALRRRLAARARRRRAFVRVTPFLLAACLLVFSYCSRVSGT